MEKLSTMVKSLTSNNNMQYLEENETTQQEIIRSPIQGLDATEYKLGHIIKGTKKECSCGKTIQEYYKVEKIVKPRTKKEMRTEQKAKKTPKFTKGWINYGYPQIYCHCNCGLNWGKH